MSGDEIEAPDTILLCVLGELNGFSVKFLIDSGANECFVGEAFIEKNRFHLTKTKEKLKIYLADGIVCVKLDIKIGICCHG